MVNVQWKDNGKLRYENLLSVHSVEGFVNDLKNRGCTDIQVISDEEIANIIHKYNSPNIVYKYKDDVMKAVRQSLGLEENDTSRDNDIMQMDKKSVFEHYCLWNGLLGYYYQDLLDAVEGIFDVKLSD